MCLAVTDSLLLSEAVLSLKIASTLVLFVLSARKAVISAVETSTNWVSEDFVICTISALSLSFFGTNQSY